MRRPAIVTTPEGATGLEERFGGDCTLVSACAPGEALDCLQRLAHEDAPVLLVLLDPSAGVTASLVHRAARLAPGAAIAFTREPLPRHKVPDQLVVSPASPALETLVSILLDRFSLGKRTAEHERQLELVSSAGVAMASSFDILAILDRTRTAAREVLDGSEVHLYYGGCPAINARPRWYPELATDRVTVEMRARLERRLVEGASGTSTEEPLALTISHQGACLGAMVVDAASSLTDDRRRLLEILGLQAATALGNIHSAQERIQFERLSAIGRMIGSIVHDFRSPLTALRGYGGMLHALDLEDAERREFASALLDECDRLDHMVEELLEFSRGRTPALARRPTPLRRYLEQLASRALRHYGDSGVTVDLDVACDVELPLDPKQFERALWNAVANASQAMGASGGRLGIRAERLGERVAIDIEDEGDGIPEEIRHRIFEPFFSYGKSEGIGLGMATAKRVAEEHGGEVEIESRRGRGTRVRFLLPLAPVERPSELAVPAAQDARR